MKLVFVVQLIPYVGRRRRRMLHFNERASIMAMRAFIFYHRIMDDEKPRETETDRERERDENKN